MFGEEKARIRESFHHRADIRVRGSTHERRGVVLRST